MLAKLSTNDPDFETAQELTPELESAWNQGELKHIEALRYSMLWFGGFPLLLLPSHR